jgi:hypothetical protein
MKTLLKSLLLYSLCCVSAFASLRMEPVLMVTSQSAATAACLAIDDEVAVQKIDYEKLKTRLLADGQVLWWPPPGVATAVAKPTTIVSAGSLPEIVFDDHGSSSRGTSTGPPKPRWSLKTPPNAGPYGSISASR